MKIFLSWSGMRSLAVAEAFSEWLPQVMQSVTPWLSSKDIAKGASWLQEVKDAIATSSGMGIFFLTADALNAPWLLFEAGGVAALEQKRVCTVLIGIDHGAVPPPLNFFQGTKLERADLLKLVKDINALLQPAPLSLQLLEKMFDRAWPEFEGQFRKALAIPDPQAVKSPTAPAVHRPTHLDGIVEAVSKSVQGIEARLGRLEEESQRSNSQIMQNLASLSAQVQMAMYRVSPPSVAPAPTTGLSNLGLGGGYLGSTLGSIGSSGGLTPISSFAGGISGAPIALGSALASGVVAGIPPAPIPMATKKKKE